MNVNKVGIIYFSLMKLQPSQFLSKTYCSKMQWRNFRLGAHLRNLPENKNSELLFTGVEHIQTVLSVSKKNNKLSKVEEKDIPTVEMLKAGNLHYPYSSPEERARKIFIEDGKIGFRKLFKFFTKVEIGKLEHEYFYRHTDILIIGAGAAGLLIAHALKSQFPHGPEITVIDKFDCFPRQTINLGQGIVTQQLWAEEEEISLLKYGIEFFSSFTRTTRVDGEPEFKLSYEPMGSLILANSKNADEVLRHNETLKNYGIKSKILSRKTLEEKFPWLNQDDVLFGSLGMYNEGTIDPWLFSYGLYCKCINLGVNFVKAEVIDFGSTKGDVHRVVCKLPDGTYNSIEFAYCVIAGGIESLNLVNLFNSSDLFNLGLNLPLEERMRYEYCFYSPKGPGLNTPIVVESDGTYFRREGLTSHYIAGVPSVISDDNGENSPYHVFESKIKPFLIKRMPHLNKLELVKGWIDVYDFCFSNKIGITGPHPDTARIVFALGFSHFGLLLLPALARAVMEFVLYDKYLTIDFTPYHVENLWKKHHLEVERLRREHSEAEKRIPLADPMTQKDRVGATSG